MRLYTTVALAAFGTALAASAGAQDMTTQYDQRHDLTYDAGGAPRPPVDNSVQAPYDPTMGGATVSGDSDFAPPVEHTVKEQNGISYITGGVGDEELAVIHAHANEFNLKVLTTAPNGEFIGTYTLTASDARGNQVFQGSSEGPLFYLNLPAGRYTIQETAENGESKQQQVSVGGRGQRQLRFLWSPQQ